MQLNNIEQVSDIAKRVNFSIFELPKDIAFSELFKNSIHIAKSQDKSAISIEDIRTITEICSNKQTEQLFIVIEEPEYMTNSAANAFLKSLEEPREKVHFVFLTRNSSKLLPTIKSRANNYYIAYDKKTTDPPVADEKILSLAKEYIGAKPNELPTVVEKILKLNKDNPRETALSVITCGIELLYKTYLLRGNQSFIQKLEKLIAAQDAITQNGHVKLQLIANML